MALPKFRLDQDRGALKRKTVTPMKDNVRVSQRSGVRVRRTKSKTPPRRATIEEVKRKRAIRQEQRRQQRLRDLVDDKAAEEKDTPNLPPGTAARRRRRAARNATASELQQMVDYDVAREQLQATEQAAVEASRQRRQIIRMSAQAERNQTEALRQLNRDRRGVAEIRPEAPVVDPERLNLPPKQRSILRDVGVPVAAAVVGAVAGEAVRHVWNPGMADPERAVNARQNVGVGGKFGRFSHLIGNWFRPGEAPGDDDDFGDFIDDDFGGDSTRIDDDDDDPGTPPGTPPPLPYSGGTPAHFQFLGDTLSSAATPAATTGTPKVTSAFKRLEDQLTDLEGILGTPAAAQPHMTNTPPPSLLGPGGRPLIRGSPDREMFSFINPNATPLRVRELRQTSRTGYATPQTQPRNLSRQGIRSHLLPVNLQDPDYGVGIQS